MMRQESETLSPPADRDSDQLLALIYDELKQIASRYMAGEQVGHTLQPTALLHEALLRIRQSTWNTPMEKAEFCVAASSVMRKVLIDHARRKGAIKRGKHLVRLAAVENLPAAELPIVDLLDLDAALEKLSELNARHAQIVQMRFFAGLTVSETAVLLGVSEATVKNDWRMARAWLLSRLRESR